MVEAPFEWTPYRLPYEHQVGRKLSIKTYFFSNVFLQMNLKQLIRILVHSCTIMSGRNIPVALCKNFALPVVLLFNKNDTHGPRK
jgi:hypothetical protein